MKKHLRKKRGKRFMFVAGIILVILVLLMIIGFIANSVLSTGELEKIDAYGKLIDINGEQMHIYSMGDGDETIVLLPGFGVALPSADFGPLMRELSKNYTVVTVEYLGIGFSDETAQPRTNENYIRETRLALEKAGFTPPYILMPHSASGIQSEYYANKYPEEIKGIIMLDTTSPNQKDLKEAPSFVYTIAKFQQTIGMTRLTAKLMPENKLVENGYTEKEISDYMTFTYHLINNSLINQSNLFINNLKEVNTLTFPSNIPVLKLVSTDTIKKIGRNYQDEHMKRFGDNAFYKLVDASHFIYQSKASEIVEFTKEFLDNIEESNN